MTPLRQAWDEERRKSHRRPILITFWSVLLICAIVSTGSLIVAKKATTTADRSEDGFCIAIKLIEGGALSDAKIANAPGVSREVKKIRTQQYRGSIKFALQLRNLKFRCDPPPNEINRLILEVERKGNE